MNSDVDNKKIKFVQLLSSFIRKYFRYTIAQLGFLHSFGRFFHWAAINISQEKACIKKDSVCVAPLITTGAALFHCWDFVSSYSPSTLSLDRAGEAPSPLPTATKGTLQMSNTYNFQNEDLFSPTRRVLLGRTWRKN